MAHQQPLQMHLLSFEGSGFIMNGLLSREKPIAENLLSQAVIFYQCCLINVL